MVIVSMLQKSDVLKHQIVAVKNQRNLANPDAQMDTNSR